MSPTRSCPESAWIMCLSGPAPGDGRGRARESLYFFTSGQACASTDGNASAAGIVFTIL